MNMLGEHEVPVAKSVMQWLGRTNITSSDEDIFIKYILLWIAFNNIYVTLANTQGIQRKPEMNKKDNSPKTIKNGSVLLPKMSHVTERAQIDVAFDYLNDNFKERLIGHNNTKFFVNRKPRWNFQEFQYDNKGQRVNGVINLGYTYSEDHISWSPIDIEKYEQFIAGEMSVSTIDCLAKQILYLLYTIRNNIFHGGKRFDDANDRKVVEKAIPLLDLVVKYFYPYHRYPH
jgi:hypothetical protein